MRTITIFYDQWGYTYRWLKPMIECREQFKERGYDIQYSSLWDYFPKMSTRVRMAAEKQSYKRACSGQYDIVMLAYHHSTTWLGQCGSDARIAMMKDIKAHCNTLIWLDTADSTGTCLFDVMPYVDLYFKKQLLKDVEAYCKPTWGGRVYCEYYHNLLGIDDPELMKQSYPVLDERYKNKLRVSWNVGIGDLMATTKQVWFHPFSRHKPKFISPESPQKNIDLQYRGSSFSPVAGYQRQYCKDFVSKVDYITHSDPYVRVAHDEYVREGHASHAILSPFGWGEVCGRDFEAFAYGATMIKMSMEHCVTFPDAYQPNKTYVPVKWDFSDLETVLRNVTSNTYKEIAQYAQNWYKHTYSEAFKSEFAAHIIGEIEK